MYEQGLVRRVGEEPWRAALRKRRRRAQDWRGWVRAAAIAFGAAMTPLAAIARADGETAMFLLALSGLVGALTVFVIGCTPRPRRMFDPL